MKKHKNELFIEDGIEILVRQLWMTIIEEVR